jgi:hypothetical protein
MGATRKEGKKGESVMSDETGLIEWSSDIRGVMSFQDLPEILAKKEMIADLITRWLAIKAE